MTIFAAGLGDIDDTVVDLDGAAVDDAGNDDRTAGAVRDQRAGVGYGAAQLERAPAQDVNGDSRADRAAAHCHPVAAGEHQDA
jgi:hypothetical protein